MHPMASHSSVKRGLHGALLRCPCCCCLPAFLASGGEDVLFYLLVAADVFVYIGDLFPVLEAAAAVAADR